MLENGKASDQFAERLLAAKNGSIEALGRLLDACRSYLMLVAEGNIRDGMRGLISASDIVQATYLDASICLARQFQGSTEAELKAWLRRILINNLLNEIRKHEAGKRHRDRVAQPGEQVFELVDTAPSPSDQVMEQEQAEAIDRALEQLPDDDRLVITLRNREKMKWDEIGQLMGRSAGAVRQLWSRALVKLHEILEPPHGTP